MKIIKKIDKDEQKLEDNNDLFFKGYKVIPKDTSFNIIKKMGIKVVQFEIYKNEGIVEGYYINGNKGGNVTDEFTEVANNCHCNDTDGCSCGVQDIQDEMIKKLRKEEKEFVLKHIDRLSKCIN